MAQQDERTAERTPGPWDEAPDFLAHWVVKTARRREMTEWYATVFGARVVHEDSELTFLSWDHEHHRLALIGVPGFVRFLFPFARYRRKIYGVDHLAVQFLSIEKLLDTYERLKGRGIDPVWAINHGPTTSLYYEDPDGIRVEINHVPGRGHFDTGGRLGPGGNGPADRYGEDGLTDSR